MCRPRGQERGTWRARAAATTSVTVSSRQRAAGGSIRVGVAMMTTRSVRARSAWTATQCGWCAVVIAAWSKYAAKSAGGAACGLESTSVPPAVSMTTTLPRRSSTVTGAVSAGRMRPCWHRVESCQGSLRSCAASTSATTLASK